MSLSASEASPDYVATKRPTQLGARAGIRVYLGTIPDYAHTDVAGVRLSGVAEGGPAAEAGLRAGDIIVEVAGRAIENIYDYTFALGDLEAGEPTPIRIERDGAELELSVVPSSRE
jgi:S1-C subfamily serine protease